MMGAFLYGAATAAGVCLVLIVSLLGVATGLVVWEEVKTRRRCRQRLGEALGGLGDEDIEALLRGDEGEEVR